MIQRQETAAALRGFAYLLDLRRLAPPLAKPHAQTYSDISRIPRWRLGLPFCLRLPRSVGFRGNATITAATMWMEYGAKRAMKGNAISGVDLEGKSVSDRLFKTLLS